MSTTVQSLAIVAAAAASAGAGWVARGADRPAAPAPVAVLAAAPRPAAPAADAAPPAPLIAVSGDGQVTLRVEQRPLDWVLEQIALQSGRPELRTAAGLPPAATLNAAAPPKPSPLPDEGAAADPGACPLPVVAVDTAELVRTIEYGTDDQRVPALQRARADGVPVPEPVLRGLLETAGSDRVRLFALDAWLEARAGDPAAERAALSAALQVPNAAVQREARQRLDDLDETERLDALPSQGSP